jgi:hypothetical protein
LHAWKARLTQLSLLDAKEVTGDSVIKVKVQSDKELAVMLALFCSLFHLLQ